ncbi:MAG TPA: hypothetical protein VN722_12085 [Hanamia sp.]|nr:hypothetical protein [Hanamia sp.]
MQIENFDLTEDDFKLIIDGLDCLPTKSFPGTMMIEIIGAIMPDQDEEIMERRKRELDTKFKKQELERQLLIENIRILQGKLLTIKRFLREQGALKEANNIINPQQ